MIPLPSCIDKAAWEGFVAMRKLTKKPLTERAAVRIIGRLLEFKAQGHDPNASLLQSECECWSDVHPARGSYAPTGAASAPKTFREEAAGARHAALSGGIVGAEIRRNPDVYVADYNDPRRLAS